MTNIERPSGDAVQFLGDDSAMALVRPLLEAEEAAAALREQWQRLGQGRLLGLQVSAVSCEEGGIVFGAAHVLAQFAGRAEGVDMQVIDADSRQMSSQGFFGEARLPAERHLAHIDRQLDTSSAQPGHEAIDRLTLVACGVEWCHGSAACSAAA